MTRFLSILALIVALVALSAPSVSVGMGARGAVWTLGDSQVSATAASQVVSCKSLGGKRVLPCHPDLGVLAAIVSIIPPPNGYRPALDIVAPLTVAAPETELPPPRSV